MADFSPFTANFLAILLADILLVSHVFIVAFAVLGLLFFVVGGLLQWCWVRSAWIRLPHLALIVFVLLQSWLGATCPLTVWEQLLRHQAGQTAYAESFVEHWLARLIFFTAPDWVFIAAYTLFGALVLLTWWWIPPHWKKNIADNKKG